MSLFTSQVTTGIDVSDRKLRLARVQRRYGNFILRAFAELNLPAGIVANGIILNPAQFVLALKELPKHTIGTHWANRDVHVGLPEQIAFLTTVPLGEGNREVVEQAALKSIPLPETDMYFDSTVVRPSKTVTVAAARRDQVDVLLHQFAEAHHEVVGLHVESEALALALLPYPLTKAPITLLADLGAARSTFALVGRGSIYFTVSYPSIISTTGIMDQALAASLQQALHYAQEHFAQVGKIQQLVLCGSGAHIPNIDQWLQQVVQLPVVIGNVLTHLKPNHVSAKLTTPAAYATAIGLALSNI
jgi:Tfp pilus assembly PilM family ATPase